YFANGNLRSADYSGSTQTIEQDGWGRRIKLTDPSAGVYDYEYDEWGQITKETTPKGYTTYSYDQSGKLLNKVILGDYADMQESYVYHPTTKLLTSSTLLNADGNNSGHVYNYDSYGRLSSYSENNTKAIFSKTYTYDIQGRIDVESIQAEDKDSGQQAIAGWKNHYLNGQLEKITLQNTGQVLWKVDDLDARGLLTSVSQTGDQ